jgi:hypothetical protein
MRLLPADLRGELAMLECVFNPIAATYMSKHLERILKLEDLENHIGGGNAKELVTQLVGIANGDLRHALNQLEIVAFGASSSAHVEKKTTIAKKTASKKQQPKTTAGTKKQPNNGGQGAKDINYDLFHGIGKVLYRKVVHKLAYAFNLVHRMFVCLRKK